MPATDTLDPPAAAPVANALTTPNVADMPEETRALIESLKPSNMESDIKPTIPYERTPVQQEQPTTTPVADPANPANPPSTPPIQPQPRTDNQPVNAGILRKQRDEANHKVKTLEQELAALKSKPATIDNKEEMAAIKAELEQERKVKAELAEKVFRTSAKDSPQWQEKASLIGEANKEISSILRLPELTDLGMKVSADDLSDPDTLNEVYAALSDGRKFAQIKTLEQALNARNVWSRELTQIEQEGAAKAQQWASQRELTVQRRLATTDAGLAKVNPILHPDTPEFKALPEATQKMITTARTEAMERARQAFNLSPEEQIDHFYGASLSQALHANENAAYKGVVEKLTAERDELAQRLKSYESHTQRPVDVGGGAQGGSPMTPEELARRLRPSLMR